MFKIDCTTFSIAPHPPYNVELKLSISPPRNGFTRTTLFNIVRGCGGGMLRNCRHKKCYRCVANGISNNQNIWIWTGRRKTIINGMNQTNECVQKRIRLYESFQKTCNKVFDKYTATQKTRFEWWTHLKIFGDDSSFGYLCQVLALNGGKCVVGWRISKCKSHNHHNFIFVRMRAHENMWLALHVCIYERVFKNCWLL